MKDRIKELLKQIKALLEEREELMAQIDDLNQAITELETAASAAVEVITEGAPDLQPSIDRIAVVTGNLNEAVGAEPSGPPPETARPKR